MRWAVITIAFDKYIDWGKRVAVSVLTAMAFERAEDFSDHPAAACFLLGQD